MNVEDFTKAERETLLHMTGLSRDDRVTRNHFAAEPDCAGSPELLTLESRGFVERIPGSRASTEMFGDLLFFRCTPRGLIAAEFLKREGGRHGS